MTLIPTQDFLGFKLARLTSLGFIDLLLERARSRREPFVAGYLNAAQVNLAFEDRSHAAALAEMDCLYADGQSVVWASRRNGPGVPERVNAGDFTLSFINRVAADRLRLALVGGRPDPEGTTGPASETARAAEAFLEWAPDLELVYLHHGYLDDEAARRVEAEIEAADPDLVLVAMGAPRQERRALQWSRRGRPRAWWCVGALLEYYAGTRRRAPGWMRRTGLEWVFRLALEPRRLWRRYLVGNPLYLWRVLRDRSPLDDEQ